MPERPDLDYVVPILDAELRGRAIVGERVRKPVVMRALAPVQGSIASVVRRAHFVVFDLGAYTLAIAPMLAGRFQLVTPPAKDPADLAVAFELDDGRELRYRDDVQMGKVYLVRAGDPVPGLTTVGIDVLSPAFTVDELTRRLKGRREQLKVFLMDKTAIDSFGNAYADETLWEARLHPKRGASSLKAHEIAALHAAMVKVIHDSSAVIQTRRPALDEKLRDFLQVRGRAGDPCSRCGTRIRTTGVRGHDAFFCPVCQPDTQGKGFVDWRKVP